MATLDKPTAKTDKKPRQPEPTTSPVENVKTYLKGVQTEWTKISWPTMPEIIRQTVVVVVMVTIMTLGLLLIDNTFSLIIRLITPPA